MKSNFNSTRLFISLIQDAGVRVYVLLYKELSGTVNLYSFYAKRRLVAQSSKGFIRVSYISENYLDLSS